MPGFPNFFMLYGPGTNGGELVSMLEAQAAYAVRALRRMTRRRVTAVEVRPCSEALWFMWLQSRMKGTSWTVSNNYFRSESGKIVTQWPSGNLAYRALTTVLGRVSETSRCRPPDSRERGEPGRHEQARPAGRTPGRQAGDRHGPTDGRRSVERVL